MFESHFKYLVFKDPEWNYLTLNFDARCRARGSAGQEHDQRDRPELEEVRRARREAPHVPRLGRSSCSRRATRSPITSSVVATVGAAQARDAVRLFMVPGMAHCGGGDGPTGFRPARRTRRVGGERQGARRRSRRRDPGTARWTARVRCARIRSARSTSDRAARTTRRTLRARSRRRRARAAIEPVARAHEEAECATASALRIR